MPFSSTNGGRDALRGVNLAPEEARGLAERLGRVEEVGRGDDKGAGADEVADVAEDLGAVGRVVGDAAAVLEVLGVAEEDDAADLLLRRRPRQLRDGVGHDRRPLAVAARDDGRIRALAVGQVEQPLGLVDRRPRRARRQRVVD